MSNIITFPRRRQQKPQTQTTAIDTLEGIGAPTVTTLKGAELYGADSALKPAEALEQALDAHRSKLLELAHRRKAFELQMTLEENTANLKLEAAGYKALVAGVPESDIYALGEDMAEALSSAMDTVAGA